MAPASTPNDIVQRMNQEINAVLAMPEVKEKLHAQYMEPIGGSVQELQKLHAAGAARDDAGDQAHRHQDPVGLDLSLRA